MGGLLKTPKPPVPAAPPVIPDRDGEAERRARRRSLAASRGRSGVMSTIRQKAGGTLGASTLLGSFGSLGGGSNDRLGGT